MSPPMEPRLSLDPSVPIRPSTSQLSTKPVPTPSRLFPRLLLLQSALSLRFQLPLPTLPQLLLPTLPQLLLPMVLTLMPHLPMVLMLLLLPLLWLPLVSLRTASNVSNALQYDVTTSITSGLFLLL